MYKKLFVLSSAILLMGCDMTGSEETPTPEDNTGGDTDVPVEEVVDTPEEDVEDPVAEVEEPATGGSHTLVNLINEGTFVEPSALQAWSDYQSVVEDATYGEITLLNEETVDFSQLDGDSKEDIDGRFESIGLRDDVYIETANVSDTEFLDYYRYPAEPESEYSETSDFLAELAFYYVDGNLMFSSITPGFYMLEMNNLPDAANLTTFLEVSEIEAIDPQVYTVAEMKINGNLIRQVMIPASNVNEEGTEEMLAFYFFIHDETIVQYAYLPFETVMQSFPDYSVMVYQQLIPTLTELDI